MDIRAQIDLISSAVKRHLLEDVMGFWEKYTVDHTNGGYLTALDRDGSVLSDEKNIWMQARQVWMFARVYLDIDANSDWLLLAQHGRDFLIRSEAYAGQGRWNYLLSPDGKKVVKGTVSIFTDCFVLMGLCAYTEASKKKDDLLIIDQTFETLKENLISPSFRDVFPQQYQQAILYYGVFMISVYALAQATTVLGNDRVDSVIRYCIDRIIEKMYDKELGAILEMKHADGSRIAEAPLYINAGHNFEGAWFIVQEAKRLGMKEAYSLGLDLIKTIYDRAWDNQYGGILFLVDAEGKTPGRVDWNEQRNLQWDEKVWWTEAEALAALATRACETMDQEDMDRLQNAWKFCQQSMYDPEYGEWYFCLYRNNVPRLMNKGGLQKAAFHVPRGLYQTYRMLEEMKKKCRRTE